jgi:hypothetical protein
MPLDIFKIYTNRGAPHKFEIEERLLSSNSLPPIDTMNVHVTCHQEESRFLRQYREREQEEPTRRPVSFNPRVKVRDIPNLEEYTPSELASMYFAANEYATIRDSIRSTLSALSHEDKDIKEKICFRGLECKTASGAAHKRGIRYLAWETVLEAQESQVSKRKHDSRSIARAYHEVSLKSSSAAFTRGLQDQIEANNFTDERARAA